MGELSDKATQSEMQDLEGTIAQSKKQDTSLLKQLLNQIPSGILGGDDHAGKADQLQANANAAQMYVNRWARGCLEPHGSHAKSYAL